VARKGLLVDFGGVLTTSVFGAFEAFSAAEGLPADALRDAFMQDARAQELLFDLELGRIDDATFDAGLGQALGLERRHGLLAQVLGGLRPDAAMREAVRAFRARGIRTGLVSNSMGALAYDDPSIFGELFDGVVISGEEGVRKPDPAIYALGARRIGLDPGDCVFVDDLPGNLKPARELGMATVHHRSAEETIAQLEELLA
jgi:epoxide hydrolase-like predicted phosphatase